MALDFDKYCLVDGSSTTVLPAPRHGSSVANRKSSGKPKYRNGTPSLTEQLEIDFRHGDYCSGSCRDFRSQGASREGNEFLKRESVYKSYKELRLTYNTDAGVGRKKIEFSPGTAPSFSLGIIDSLCSLDEESLLFEQNRVSVMSLSLSEQNMASAYGGVIEFCYDDSAITMESVSAATEEKYLAANLNRSLSARFTLPHSPAKSECDSSRASSLRNRFRTIKMMINPFVKSKSRRSTLNNFTETHCEPISGLDGISRNKAVYGSTQGDILEKLHNVEYNHRNEEKDNHNSVPQCSPTHLHGLLKTGNKHGVPYFQFSVKSPEDVYVAKIWRVKNASTWVYTFHLLPSRTKHSTSGWEFEECKRKSLMVGKMYVSHEQYTKSKGSGQVNDSMVTEFVLHDILHSRNSTASQDKFGSFAAAQELENAAIIMQVPLGNRESLKFKNGDKEIDETRPNLLGIYGIGKLEGASYSSSSAMMHVLIPAGSHSFPISGNCGPSPLLDRRRLGGGCDCGGWDMACPLNIFTNKIVDDRTRVDLYLQGRKDNIPGFTMRVMGDGKYAVDFHAQLSSLQAFSICVASLHTAEAEQEKMKAMVQSDLTEEEMKSVQDAMADEENKMEQVMPSNFIVNPIFSPVARVYGDLIITDYGAS